MGLLLDMTGVLSSHPKAIVFNHIYGLSESATAAIIITSAIKAKLCICLAAMIQTCLSQRKLMMHSVMLWSQLWAV